jgi:hypothetical protein
MQLDPLNLQPMRDVEVTLDNKHIHIYIVLHAVHYIYLYIYMQYIYI